MKWKKYTEKKLISDVYRYKKTWTKVFKLARDLTNYLFTFRLYIQNNKDKLPKIRA